MISTTPRSSRRITASLLAAVFMMFVAIPALFAPLPAAAQGMPVMDAENTMTNAYNKITGFLKNTLVDGVAIAVTNAANYFLQQMAYELANGIVSGCPGQKPCFSVSALGSMAKNAYEGAIGEAIGSLSQTAGFNFCDPGIDIRLSLQLGMLDQYKPPKPKCDFNDVVKNWKSASRALSNKETYAAMWDGFKPGKSGLSVGLKVNLQSYELAQEKKFEATVNRILDDLSGGGFTGVKDPVTGNVLVPGAMVRKTAEDAADKQEKDPRESNQITSAAQMASGAVWGNILNNAFSTFTSTLISGAWNKAVGYLLSPQEAARIAALDEVLLSADALLSVGNKENAVAVQVNFAPPPLLEASVFDPLTLMSVCPSSGRGLYNCTADSQLSNAVRISRGTTMTVGSALEKNMLHGDWPLISNNDEARNTDPSCYSYGYCFSNLQKLRAARILSVGWEIAASLSPTPPSKPWTLKQVVNGFRDCNAQGQRDNGHPFCHLIDPDWVLVQPAAQCLATSYGPLLMSPESALRQQQCVDLASCLVEADDGSCVGGYGYCMAEDNIWRFDGDSCPAQYASCRSLKSRDGKTVAYNLNTVDYGVCNASNVGCTAYAEYPHATKCSLATACSDANGCLCTVPLAVSCTVMQGETSCHNNINVCSLYGPCRLAAGCGCTNNLSLHCRVEPGSKSCITSVGDKNDPADDWLLPWARHLTVEAKSCKASDVGCTGLVKLSSSQSLNLIRNSGFEELQDADGDGVANEPKYWSAYGAKPNFELVTDSASVISGARSATPGPDVYGQMLFDVGTINPPCNQDSCIGLFRGVDDYQCRIVSGQSSCIVTNRLFQDGLRVRPNATFTVSADFRRSSASSFTSSSSANYGSLVAVYFSNEAGVIGSLDSGFVSVTPNDSALCQVAEVTENNTTRTVILAKVKPYDSDATRGRANCTFAVRGGASASPIAFATVEIVAPSGVYVDNVMLEEGGGTTYHEGYGNASEMTYAKVAPSYLGCTGEAGDLLECANYAPVCRENEVGCDLYIPANGDPSVPGIAGAQDRCPAECSGYEAFKQLPSPFDADSNRFNYFIPSTARVCTALEVGCSQFTDLGTEAKKYYSELRLCQRPDAADSTNYYTWEGSDVTGYQLKNWRLKQEGQASSLPSDVLVASATAFAPCTGLSVDDVNSCDNDTTAGICSQGDITAGNFDCREFYDAAGNRFYRLLSKTIVASADCRRYRITDSTYEDCRATNGTWDATKSECVYAASSGASVACSASASGCRAFHGNAAANVRQVFTHGFESSDLGGWKITNTGTGIAVSQSAESVTVGGHSVKLQPSSSSGVDLGLMLTEVSDGGEIANEYGLRRGAAYIVTFWARGGATADGTPKLVFNWRTISGNYAAQPATVIATVSEWAQYEVGPFRPSDYLGALDFTVQAGGSDAYLDNIVLKEVQDNIYVVRNSWKTPSSCDQTADGAPSPQEMLGCREYRTLGGVVNYLRSFSRLCREQAVGCAAFGLTQNTPDDPYTASYGLTCELSSACVPAAGAVNCPCHYSSLPLVAGITRNAFPARVNKTDVCRVAPGEKSCRFNLAEQPIPGAVPPTADRVVVPADQRVYLAVTKQNECASSALGCRSFGLPKYGNETDCHIGNGFIAGPVVLGTTRTYTCTHYQSGATCSVTSPTALNQADVRCKIFSPTSIVTGWTAASLLDRPADYAKTLCNASAVGCDRYTTKDGEVFFKSPGTRTCQYKEGVTYGGQKHDGWFRKNEAGQDVPCTPDYQSADGEYGIAKSGDVSCSLVLPCVNPAGCPCMPIGAGRSCTVLFGQVSCGYQGWVGLCEDRYDMCEEFIDPADTTASHPAGQPYYYIMNARLDTKSCASGVDLKNGCVIFKRTSDLRDTSAAAPTYALAEIAKRPVPPVNCNNPASLNADQKKLCEQRCFSERDGYCSATGASCRSDAECLGGPSDSCEGTGTWTTACRTNADCDLTLGESCKSIVEQPSEEPCSGFGCQVGQVGFNPLQVIDQGDNRPTYGNDGNIVIKVRRDRQCASWLQCNGTDVSWDSEAGRWRKSCYSFGLCEEAGSQPGQCAKFNPDPIINRLTTNAYTARDTSWRGSDFSGYVFWNRYLPHQLVSVDIRSGYCRNDATQAYSTVGGQMVGCDQAEDCGTGESCIIFDGVCAGENGGTWTPCTTDTDMCPAGQYCSTSFINTFRFGVRLDLCSGGSREGLACSSSNQNEDCPGTDAACVGACTQDDDCVKPRGETKPDGSCVRGQCYYSFYGGPLHEEESVDSPACRAYPEQDSPYPLSVLSSFGSYGLNGEPGTRYTDFGAANACVGGNDCECNYSRIGYGSGLTQRFHSQESTAPNKMTSYCFGGDWDGYECSSAKVGSVKTAEECRNAGGSCEKLKTLDYANGWPGFCLDQDYSTNINHDQNRFNCILWLPVDKIAGLPSPWDQHREAGWIPPADVSTLGYCTEGWATKQTGVSHVNSVVRLTPPTGSGALQNIWTAFPSLVATEDGNGVWKKFDLSSTKIHKSDLVAIRFKFNDGRAMYLVPKNNSIIVTAGGFTDFADFESNPINNQAIYEFLNSETRTGIRDHSGIKFSAFHGNEGEGIVPYGEGADGIAMEELYGSYLRWIQTESGHPNGDRCALFLEGLRQGLFSALGELSVMADRDKGKWGDTEDWRQCMGAVALFDANNYLKQLVTVMAVSSDVESISANAYADAIVRTSCRELATVSDTSGDIAAAPRTNALYQAKTSAFNSAYPAVHSTDRDIDPNDLSPYGRVPVTVAKDPNAAYANAEKLAVPVWTSEYGASWTKAKLKYSKDEDDNTVLDFSLNADTAQVAGIPLRGDESCDVSGGNCYDGFAWPDNGESAAATLSKSSGLDVLKTLFARAWNVWEFASSSGIYDPKANKSYDMRFDYANVPTVYAVDPNDCQSDYLCPEGPKDALSVNGIYGGQVITELGAGSLKSSLRFYMAAHPDQMPIRRIRIDFGNDTLVSDDVDQLGYFRNRRGMNVDRDKICSVSVSGDVWGYTPSSCDATFVQTDITYSCSADSLRNLTECNPDNLRYPCRDNTLGACVFRPRVQIIDNWGNCNGNCPYGAGLCRNEGGPEAIFDADTNTCGTFSEVTSFNRDPNKANVYPWTWGPEVVVFPSS